MNTRVAITVVLSALVAAGCHRDSGQAPTREQRTPTVARERRGAQTLVTAITSDPRTFNPILSSDQTSATAFGPLFDPLVRLDPRNGNVVPALAQSWQMDPDGRAYTFQLRTDVRWHDGEPFTARDVAFTFRAIYSDSVPNPLRRMLSVDGEPFDISIVDEHTVRVQLPHPFAPLLHFLTIPILPEHLLGEILADGRFTRQWGIDTPPEELIGTGPYRMVAYEPGRYLRYRRNPDYWMRDGEGRALPYLQKQVVRIVPDAASLFLQFVSGKTDIHNVHPDEVIELQQRKQALGIRVRRIGIDTGSLFLSFNRNPRRDARDAKARIKRRWFSDTTFLRALAHSVNRRRMVQECLHGFGEPAVAYISPANQRFHHPSLVPYRYDRGEALRLLESGGYTREDKVLKDSGKHVVAFDLYTNSGNSVRNCMCKLLAEDWKALGLRVDYRPVDFSVLVNRLQKTFEWDAVLIGFTGVLEPHNAASLLRSSGVLHLWNPRQAAPATAWEAEIDRLLDAGASEMNPEARRLDYLRIQEILHEQLPMMQTVRRIRFSAFRNTLRNFAPTVWGLYRPELIHFGNVP